jgi:transcriptional regulator of acetoin/glycerol metabolism
MPQARISRAKSISVDPSTRRVMSHSSTPVDAACGHRGRIGEQVPLAHTPGVLVLTEPRHGESVDHPVAARWARAAALGVRRDGDAYPVGPGDADLAERRARFDDVLAEQRGLLDPIARQLAAGPGCAVVTDADGIILSCHAVRAFDDPAVRVRLVPGADWSERARGTNAIGTAIAERGPVAVIGKAHYEQRNGALFCYASPVFDAAGELAAVIDVSGALQNDDPALARSVREAAAVLERALREMAYARAGFRNLAVLERLVLGAGAPTLLVEPRGPVRLHNDAARQALMRGHDRLDCESIFGASFAALAEMAREGREARFETRDHSFRVHMDPVVDPRDRTLGIVVHLEPVPATAPRISTPPPKAGASLPAPLPPSFDGIHATDPGVVAAKRLAATFAPTVIPVLLLAETGTGKELFARAIHAASACAAGPCVAINCGAVSPSLLESELFGYAPGAFTGAGRAGSGGLLGEADGGTLFLDEIAEMPEALQAALLRALEDGTYRRLGDPRPRRSSFRLIAATCRDLAARVEQGSFRSDLFYRIQGACIRIPALRDRTDRAGLARALVAQQRDVPLAPSAVKHIEAHTWPGNVRELKSAVTHALALCGEGPIEREHFPEPLIGGARTSSAAHDDGRTRREVLRDAASEALKATGGNVSEAARRLGVARDTLYRMIRRS